jgi:hypothetical protein
MTQDEIIEIARQIARQPDRIYAPDEKEFLYYFAKLVAAKEHEAIIDLVAFYGGSVDLEAAIRARGEA